jgi:hypothetical protein
VRWLILTFALAGCRYYPDGPPVPDSGVVDAQVPSFVPDLPPLPGASGGAGQLAIALRGRSDFLVGLGNDLGSDRNHDAIYTLGVTLDLHYAYLVGLQGQNGWPDWNPNGGFVDALTSSAAAHGVTPMFTLYSMAAWGENNLSVLTNDGYMGPYWKGAKLLFQHLGTFGGPAVVHLEPDFWAFVQKGTNGDPTAHPVHVAALASECAGLPDDLTGMGHCLVRLARTYAPHTAIGFHASSWAGDPGQTVAFLQRLGASDADFVVVETLDRDAGCFEAASDSGCQGRSGPFYWDESNQSSPNFHEHLAWAKSIHDGLARPLLWWQTPLGVPSATPGGSSGHYRDNRVHYLFGHVGEFVAAGGVGAVFGVGAQNQTDITTDGGQFRNAVTQYLAAPVALP